MWRHALGGRVFTLSATVMIRNSIISGNQPLDLVIVGDEGVTNVEHSIVGKASDGSGSGIDPLFARMPNPGSNGWDGVDDDYGDLRLRSGSPAIDGGDNAAVPPDLMVDADQRNRFNENPGAGETGSEPVVDIGAYEYRPAAVCGDGVCAANEECDSCACGPCCGNGTCETFENCVTCKNDCPCVTLSVPDVYPSIQLAIDVARDGDVVSVKPGTYQESINFNGKTLRVHGGDGAAVTTLDGTGLESPLVVFNSGEGRESTLQGFAIKAATA